MAGPKQDSRLKPFKRTLRHLQLLWLAILYYPKNCTYALNRNTMTLSTELPTVVPLPDKNYATNVTFTEDKVESSYPGDINAHPSVTTVRVTTRMLNALHDSNMTDSDDVYPEHHNFTINDGREEEGESEADGSEHILREYENDVSMFPGEMSATQFYSDDYYEDLSFVDFTTNIYSSVIIVISLPGIIGNILVYLAWSKVKHSNSTAFLLSFLSIVDFVFLLLMLSVNIFFLSTSHFTYRSSWILYFAVYLSYAGQFLSIFTTALVSIIRYIAVKFPFKVKNWFKNSIIKVILVILTGVSFLLAFPASSVSCLYLYFYDEMGYEYEVYRRENVTSSENNNSLSLQHLGKDFGAVYSRNLSDKVNTVTPLISATFIESGEFAQEPQHMNEIEVCRYTSEDLKKIFLIITATMMNVVPWIVVIPMNLLLINQVRKSFKERKQMLSKEEQNNFTMNVVVVIVSLQSILAYPLFFAIKLLSSRIDWAYYFGGEPPLVISDANSIHVNSLSDCFHIINSSLNIVAYCACGRVFRKILMQDVFKCRPREPRSGGDGLSKARGIETNEHGVSFSTNPRLSQTTPEVASQYSSD